MSMRRSVKAALAAVTTAVLVGAGVAAVPSTASASSPASPLRLHTPMRETIYSFHNHAFFRSGIQLIAVGQEFEIWSHRSDYHSPITSEWHHGSTVTQLPAGLMDDFSGLTRFLDVSVQNDQGRVVLHRQPTICLNSYTTYRVVPDGAAHSLYPYDCPSNIFTLGSVQGIAAGWAADTPMFGYNAVHLAPGHYSMRVTITPQYRNLFGISLADGQRTVALTVRKSKGGGPGPIPGAAARTSQSAPSRTGQRLASPPSGPRPDLAALPAWGMSLSKTGRYLNFSATVWNAGDSPLVVDGFREKGKAVMDSYQYFYDSDGNQVGYVPAGHMIWDPRPTHHHWHFEDFARYQLVDANKHDVQLSHKEAFCLAATDAIDFTVPGALWHPYNTDLSTACGDYSALAVSEVLPSGSGDTYEQFRAGQSFDLKGLPNGIYYIKIQANPDHVLTEQSLANNTSYREIRIGGAPDHRTLHVFPKGDVNG